MYPGALHREILKLQSLSNEIGNCQKQCDVSLQFGTLLKQCCSVFRLTKSPIGQRRIIPMKCCNQWRAQTCPQRDRFTSVWTEMCMNQFRLQSRNRLTQSWFGPNNPELQLPTQAFPSAMILPSMWTPRESPGLQPFLCRKKRPKRFHRIRL